MILRDSAFIDVEGLVRYVYRGEVDVRPERLQSFLRTAELLKIKGLAEQTLAKNNDKEEEIEVEVKIIRVVQYFHKRQFTFGDMREVYLLGTSVLPVNEKESMQKGKKASSL